jgi:nitrite reductase/ring-hydroxylating ferredoxin subunit
MVQAYALSKSAPPEVVPQSEIVGRLTRGEVIVLKRGLQELRVFDPIQEATFAAIRERFGEEAERNVRACGFEKIHTVLDGAQLETLWREVHGRMQQEQLRFCKRIGQELMGVKKPFYLQDAFLVRFFTPQDVVHQNRAVFEKSENLGRLSLQSPHHDYWYSVPMNTINLWIAIGRVNRFNGMIIHTDSWGYSFPRNGAYVAKDQRLGVPMSIECDPGDVLLFHSRHMHSSVLNASDETRYVFTSRLVLEEPIPHTVQELDKVYYYSPMIGSRLQRFAHKANHFSWFYIREKIKYAFWKKVGRLGAKTSAGWIQQAARLMQAAFRYRKGDVTPNIPKDLRRPLEPITDLSELKESEIAPFDRGRCAVRIGGDVHVIGRYCPHEGADLSAGFVEDGQVVCPWHYYHIDPKTGRGACFSLRGIKVGKTDETHFGDADRHKTQSAAV